MVEKPTDEVVRRRPKPSLVEAHEAHNVAREVARLVLVARNDPLWPRCVRHGAKESLLDEPITIL